ncbi:endonuclease MutS2 [Thermoanaerobacter pentosaceus]|jgi:DNA mismatch repair protein MutS2|uniref:Endonuclease MutS2 n=1 Tax=Thermoanaerobacter pentosaceus TaxID=694059 RepID=A0ABT9M6X6_9THEO|nr:endonuclease MutS2 [Thermoanaerobacter pentosaceus]MDP9751879.1 DNA mismatch repair protein MutS2 [Thermoanaerobacter pentosaceus]
MVRGINSRALKSLEFDKIVEFIVSYCDSDLGKQKASDIVIKKDIEEIERELDLLNEAIYFISSYGGISFAFEDIRDYIKKAQIDSVLYNKELLKIKKFLKLVSQIKGYFKNLQESDRFVRLKEYDKKVLPIKDLEKRIENIIISEDEIADDASPLLKSLRRQKSAINEKIRATLNSIISTRQKELQEPIITVRQGRYVVPVKQEYRSTFKGIVHDQSSSGATLFIEPMQVVDLNNELRQVELKERQEIQRILFELSQEVKKYAQALFNDIEIVSELDFTFAKAKYSLKLKAVRPELNTMGYINLKKARHPLINQEAVVPIDIYIGDQFNTLVITGPNTGGKTVTLKTVGLLTIMAMAGLNIPAEEGSQVSIFEEIFVDIGDEQSIEQSLSTFSSHMTNIISMLQKVNKNCLALLDELGAGTDPVEGAALAMSILDTLHKIGAKTIATTHYSELKQYALKTAGVENASVEFDVETLKPTYKLIIGLPGKSNAFEIAKRLGLPRQIIEDARKYISREALKFEDIIADVENKRRELEKANHEVAFLRKNVEILKEELEKEKKRLQNERDKILKEAKERARKIVQEAKFTAEGIIKKIREAEESTQNKDRIIQEVREELKKNLEELEEEVLKPKEASYGKIPDSLKEGQTVYIVPLGQDGIVLSLPDKSGNVEVQAGILKMTVHISNLRVVEEKEDEVVKKGYSKFVHEKSQSISTSIDVRGKNLDDALLEVEKYIDDAYLAGLTQVTIIHGRGTGVLRTGISQFLRSNKHVKSFRLGKYGEGGDGVTIVELVDK